MVTLRLLLSRTRCPVPRRGDERRSAPPGFTLLELIVVVSIIGILATIAMPALRNVPRRAAESVLKSNLWALRDVIDQYKADKGNYPPSLDALVEEGYMRSVPIDPITKATDTWELVYEEIDPDEQPAETELPEDAQPGIIDVHSGSDAVSLDGIPYREW